MHNYFNKLTKGQLIGGQEGELPPKANRDSVGDSKMMKNN